MHGSQCTRDSTYVCSVGSIYQQRRLQGAGDIVHLSRRYDGLLALLAQRPGFARGKRHSKKAEHGGQNPTVSPRTVDIDEANRSTAYTTTTGGGVRVPQLPPPPLPHQIGNYPTLLSQCLTVRKPTHIYGGGEETDVLSNALTSSSRGGGGGATTCETTWVHTSSLPWNKQPRTLTEAGSSVE